MNTYIHFTKKTFFPCLPPFKTLATGVFPLLALVTGALDSASAALLTLPGLCSNVMFGNYGDNLKYHRASRPLV